MAGPARAIFNTPEVPTESQPVEAQFRQHIPALDGLRGIAILMVLVVHTAPAAWKPVTGVGVLGVDLFFVLSGFLITRILLRTCGRENYFRNFYCRRFLRLFPVYYSWLAVVAILPFLHEVLRLKMPDYHGNWLWYLLYLNNWKHDNAHDAYLGQLWSLAVEEQFYLVWPLLIRAIWQGCRNRGSRADRELWLRAGLFAVCIAIIAGSFAYRATHDDVTVVYRSTFARAETLAMGSLLALWARPAGTTLRLLSVFLGGLLVLASFSMAWFNGGELATHWPARTWGQFAGGIGFAGIVFWTASGESGTGWLKANWLRTTGKYSYAMYVVHLGVAGHVGWVLVKAGASEWMMMAISIAATYLCGWASWRWIESPILRLKERF